LPRNWRQSAPHIHDSAIGELRAEMRTRFATRL
jgi:hypothetical protein